MSRVRERWVAALGVLVVVVLAVAVALTLQDARDRGRRALDRHQREAVDQFATTMEVRVRSAFETFALVAAAPFTLEPGDPGDSVMLAQAKAVIPETHSEVIVVDPDGRVVNSTTSDPALTGTKLDRTGLGDVLASGRPAMLPVASGIATPGLAFVLATPIPGSDGIRGAHLFEVQVSPDSDFSHEIASLGKAGGRYMFLDPSGMVLVANEAEMLGNKIDDPALTAGPNGLRRVGDRVVATADVPSANWRLVFVEDANAFESGLGGRVQLGVGLVVVLGLLMAAMTFVVLVRRLQAERRERRRMAEITSAREELVDIVSHELRTPVAGVVGFLQSALDHWSDADEEERRLGVRRTLMNAQRLQALTRDVLDVRSLESGELTYVFDVIDLRSQVEAAVMTAREDNPDRVISLADPGAPIWVRADGGRMQQVLANLLGNAVLHSPPDREVSVSVEVVDGETRVAVTDHGPGLSSTDTEEVFEKFVRGRGAGARGSGLALYIARKIVDAHGGRIWAGSAQGGARFTFALPLAPTPAESVT